MEINLFWLCRKQVSRVKHITSFIVLARNNEKGDKKLLFFFFFQEKGKYLF